VSGVDDLVHLVRPAVGEPDGALVLLHGRGANEHDLVGLLDALDPARRLVGATPRAPLALPPGGAHWYVLGGLGTPDPTTFSRTFPLAAGWLDAFLDQHRIPYERTILGGFSQGAVMTHALALARGRARPGGIIALSGFMPTVPGFELDLNPPLPRAAIAHGTYDTVIGVEWGRDANERLTAAGADVLYRESPIPHAIDPAVVAELREWIPETLGGAVSSSRSPGSPQ
jgi:phospholipase/carboxylesterase